jgi:arylsulfatase A-like enzyme
LCLHHFAVHTPIEAKTDLIARFQTKPPVGGHNNPVYAAMIASVDESVGRVLAVLAEVKLAANTLVIFTSDNGGVGGKGRDGIQGKEITDNAPLRGGKGMFYEGGVRVPYIFRWPGRIAPGSTSDVPINSVDLYPTLLEVAAARRPAGQVLDGTSYLSVLTGGMAVASVRPPLFWHFPGYLGGGHDTWRTLPVGTIRAGDWKLMEFLRMGDWNSTISARTSARSGIWPRCNPKRPRNCRRNYWPGARNSAPQCPRPIQARFPMKRSNSQTAPNDHRFLKTLLHLLPCLFSVALAHAADKPNILFIAVDDLRPELGCYGRDYIKSPNIDRIARAGMVFNRAYCQQAVCSPTRSSLMTGTRPDTTKVWDLVTHFRVALPEVVTLGQHFKQHGYFVQGMGKIYHGGLDDAPTWSVPWQTPKAVKYASPENVTLDQRQYEGEPDANAPKKGSNRIAAKAGSAPVGPPSAGKNSRGPAFEGADVPDSTFVDGKVAELAVSTLSDLSQKKEPFFLAVGFSKPHLPFVSPKKYWDLYAPAKIQLAPNTFRPKDAPDYAILPGGGLRNYHGIPAGSIPDDLARQLKHGYYAAISYTDAQIGKILDELDRLGLTRNTIVVLWGDHGWKLGEHDAWCKHSNSENDANAPLLLSVPGMKAAGSHTDALVEFVDIYPTLAELAGLPLPTHLEGTSMKPLLDDPKRPWKSAAFSQYPRSQKGGLMGYSMRTDRYRLTVWVAKNDQSQVDAIELYDHEVDPQENLNLAGRPESAGLVKQLMAQWKQGWQGALPPSAAGR